MKAVRLAQPGRPLETRKTELPDVGNDDLLVRVKAAGICHTDVHYRAGWLRTGTLPITLGHEVSGMITETGADVTRLKAGDRVCLHYMTSCGHCSDCKQGNDQFCESGSMIGKDINGGFAEYIRVPARNAFRLPPEIPFEQAAIMMCSSATSLHALRRGRVKSGESVAVWGVGGLGVSAVQLAASLGAEPIFAIDLNETKLAIAGNLGAFPIRAATSDPAEEVLRQSAGRGVDVALDFVGLPVTLKGAIASLAVGGRVVVSGLSDKPFEINPYRELLNREIEIIGVSDHLAEEIPPLIEMVRKGELRLAPAISRTIPLDADEINAGLDELERGSDVIRIVITP
jgi:propanol-preferring alcohol dehydrogenase